MTTTNVMRILTKAGIPFTHAEYEVDESDLSGAHAAAAMGLPVERVFKTLVAKGDKNGLNVFVIPVAEELDLKKCAAVSGNKSMEMIHVRELLPATGYIRGGCSPIGMKKHFPTFLDRHAAELSTVIVSAGRIGRQVELAPADLLQAADAQLAELIE